MNAQETKKVLAILQTAYPHFYKGYDAEQLQLAVKLWAAMFADDDYKSVSAAVSALIVSRTEGFPPTIGQVKAKLYEVTNTGEMTEAEAWALVRKAIGNSAYHAAEEYARLPEMVQDCVTPEQLRAWAIDEDFNEGVMMSHFVRSYRQRAEQRKMLTLMPASAKNALEAHRQKLLEGAAV